MQYYNVTPNIGDKSNVIMTTLIEIHDVIWTLCYYYVMILPLKVCDEDFIRFLPRPFQRKQVQHPVFVQHLHPWSAHIRPSASLQLKIPILQHVAENMKEFFFLYIYIRRDSSVRLGWP